MKTAVQVNRRREKAIVVKATVYQGICPSCANLSVCSLAHGSRTPVTFCEEFANNGTPEPVSVSKKQEVVTEGRATLERYKGLCATCESSDNCIFPKDEAGIWRCEEYR